MFTLLFPRDLNPYTDQGKLACTGSGVHLHWRGHEGARGSRTPPILAESGRKICTKPLRNVSGGGVDSMTEENT